MKTVVSVEMVVTTRYSCSENIMQNVQYLALTFNSRYYVGILQYSFWKHGPSITGARSLFGIMMTVSRHGKEVGRDEEGFYVAFIWITFSRYVTMLSLIPERKLFSTELTQRFSLSLFSVGAESKLLVMAAADGYEDGTSFHIPARLQAVLNGER